MRSVPTELKQKLLKRFYGTSTDSLPQIQVIAKQANINTLISEVIHEDIPSDFGDVAIRQLPGEVQPSMAYAVCVDNGEGNIYSRNLPAYAEEQWKFCWSLGAVKDVAIEYNGEWYINPKKRYYGLITEEYPYIFFVDSSDNLYVQKWDDINSRVLLAAGVSQISVCRGWQSTLDTGVDQGLIIGYLRGGMVFYRAYCQQSTGEYIWEIENEVTELGTGNVSLCVFRTNDFRIGFLTENAGVMNYVLSERTYAGQAMPPEYAMAQANAPILWTPNLRFYYPQHPEHGIAIPDKPYMACYDKDEPALAIVTHERIGLRELVITINRPVGGVPGAIENYITTSPARSISSCVWQNGNELKITLGADLTQNIDFTITIRKCHEAWQVINGQRMAIEATSFVLPGQIVTTETILREAATVDIAEPRVYIELKTDRFAYLNESAIATPESVAITLQPTSVLPI